ncbi:hypothetical protein NDU88_000822 [Pleurodeles waltl]|uniref:Zinc finger CCHC domain-containing protein n=1 Tax=Pleurodeles waltl TaxID=8319 RepID=A0AAV7KUG9_PLEWA|nr:hypothetical protein NDU88_000822 [Pleurodeles waltl]
MAVSGARRNAVRFSAVEDVKMDGLLFSQSVLQKELGFRPDQIDYLFAFPGGCALWCVRFLLPMSEILDSGELFEGCFVEG